MKTTEKIEIGDIVNGEKCIGFCPSCGCPIFDGDDFSEDEYGAKVLDECPQCHDNNIEIIEQDYEEWQELWR